MGNWESASRRIRTPSRSTGTAAGHNRKYRTGRHFCGAPNWQATPATPRRGRQLYDCAASELPRPGSGLANLHIILAHAVIGEAAGLDAGALQMETAAREGRYPSGSYLPTLARGFAAFERADFGEAIRRSRRLPGKTSASAAAARSMI